MSDVLNSPAGDDYEWVNAWAARAAPAIAAPPERAQRPPGSPSRNGAGGARVLVHDLIPAPAAEPAADNPAVPPEPKSHADFGTLPAEVREPLPVPDTRALRPGELPAPKPDPDSFVHPATRRFFVDIRTSPTVPEQTHIHEQPATTQPETQAEAASAVSPMVAVPATEPPVSNAAPPVAPVALSAAEQLKRDIADISFARDALLAPAMPTTRRRARGAFATLRNAESVPILVGSVVGATLVAVFGAAASLVRLR